MSLKDWLANGWLKPHQPDRQEINNLLNTVQRDLTDASLDTLSPDWQFGIAYSRKKYGGGPGPDMKKVMLHIYINFLYMSTFLSQA